MSRYHRLKNHKLTIPMFTLVAFCIIGCSYTPNSTIVANENLTQYNPKDFSTKSTVPTTTAKANEEWIMKAIWYEQQGDFANSNLYYAKLYETTQSDEYLIKELTTALYSGKGSNNLSKLENYVQKNPQNVQGERLLISFYLNEKKYNEAKGITKQLLSHSTQPIDFELSANPYILSGDYKEGVKLLDEAYNKTFNEDILLKITTLLASYIGDVDGAVQYLESHRHIHECSEKICLQLVEIYSKQQKVKELIDVYQDLYEETHKEVYAEKLIETYLYAKEYAPAIVFLQSEYKNDELLYELYLEKHDYVKAEMVADKLYKDTGNAKWIAESAMAQYENATDKNDAVMLQKVVNKFEEALSKKVDDSIYLNYYGYTLIDKNIDIQKGIDIIEKALKQQPDNSYYLDSLAWGYFKLGNCEKAYSNMKRVVEIEGLDEDEIRGHWNAIDQKCKK